MACVDSMRTAHGRESWDAYALNVSPRQLLLMMAMRSLLAIGSIFYSGDHLHMAGVYQQLCNVQAFPDLHLAFEEHQSSL